MADDRPFLLPVAIDDTVEARARVPEEFRGVQWTHLSADHVPPAFVDRVLGLLSHGSAPEANRPAMQPRADPIASTDADALRTAADRSGAGSVRRVLWMLGAVVLIGLGVVALSRLVHRPGQSAAPSVPEKSVAVLPFVDMSERRDQEYFSDGLTEELIDHLANTPELKVIARTSSFQFKGKNEDVRTIAEKLGVANILEGSVRKSGNELRVTAQLIRAADGTHLWSKIYDRDLKDIFKLQDEIATTVSSALRVALSPASRAPSARPTNLEAYNLVLKGNYYFARGNMGDDAEAIKSYLEAIRLAPDYAQAWGRLARTYIWQSVAGELPPAEAAAKARQAAQRALAIDPNCAVAHYALGNVHRFYDYDWKAAIGEFGRVQALDPYGAEGANSRSNIDFIKMYQSGRTDKVISSALEVVAHNPLDTDALNDLAWVQRVAGQLEASAATSRRLLELNADFPMAQQLYASTLLLMGRPADALTAVERESDEPWRLAMLACVQWALGHRAESFAASGKLQMGFANRSAYQIAISHACRGEKDVAIDWLERAYGQRAGPMAWVWVDPVFRSLHGQPRYQALLVKMNLAD